MEKYFGVYFNSVSLLNSFLLFLYGTYIDNDRGIFEMIIKPFHLIDELSYFV